MQALLGAAATKIPTSVTSALPASVTSALPASLTTPSLIPKIPVWLYRLIAIFPVTGMAGLDHYLLGSQQTAFAKFLVNLLTFGSWYVFDILQSLDAEKVAEKGLDFPFYGGGAVGKGRTAVDAKDLGPTGEAFLNLFFTCVAGSLYFIDQYGLVKQPSPIGDAAKVLSPILLTATTGLLALTAYSFFKSANLVAAAGIGSIAAAAGIADVGGLSGASIPGLTGATPSLSSLTSLTGATPSLSSLTSLTKQLGGGTAKSSFPSMDFLALGILTMITAAGFTLSAVRSRGAL